MNTRKHKTKFSGVKDEYPTGATRDRREGKGRYDLISPLALKRLAGVYERGAKNHGDRNWEMGIPYSRLMDSALRHTNQHLSGMRDEDHIAQAVWNLMALLHFDEQGRGQELDDLPGHDVRFKKLKPTRLTITKRANEKRNR